MVWFGRIPAKRARHGGSGGDGCAEAGSDCSRLGLRVLSTTVREDFGGEGFVKYGTGDLPRASSDTVHTAARALSKTV